MSLLISQILGIVVTVAIVLVLDLSDAAVVKALFHGSLRADEADEALGLDASQHGERCLSLVLRIRLALPLAIAPCRSIVAHVLKYASLLFTAICGTWETC